MNKYILVLFVAVLVGLVGFFMIANSTESQQAEERNKTDPERIAMNEFVQCLAEEDVVVYGSETCPACFRFAQQFGGYDVIDPIYVECSKDREACAANMQTGFVPEVQIDGNVLEGDNSLERLAQVTGCKLDLSE